MPYFSHAELPDYTFWYAQKSGQDDCWKLYFAYNVYEKAKKGSVTAPLS